MSDSSFDSDSEEDIQPYPPVLPPTTIINFSRKKTSSLSDATKTTDVFFHPNTSRSKPQHAINPAEIPEKFFPQPSQNSSKELRKIKFTDMGNKQGFLPSNEHFSQKKISYDLKNEAMSARLPFNHRVANKYVSKPQHTQHDLDMRTKFSENKSNVTFSKLLEWANNQNYTILVFQMSMDVAGLQKLLRNDSINFDWMHNLIIALKNVLGAQAQKGSLHYVLKCICDSTFFDLHLKSFIQQMAKCRHPEMYGIITKILDIIEYLVDNLRTVQYNSKYNQALFFILENGQNYPANFMKEGSDLLKKVEKLIKLTSHDITHAPQKQYTHPEYITKKKKFVPVADDDEPPDDFRFIEIFPDTEELYSPVEPFLRANKTKGAYRDLHHYLDIHARLMKEDYLAPIRIGLKQYKETLARGEKAKEHDLRFYYEVKIQMKPDEDQGITHLAIFDNTGMEKIEWEYSKRLMFGSLLVFSKDQFQTTIFATVANRNVDKLEKGIIEVVFHNNLEVAFTSSEHDRFVMAETTAYFESHRHVLEGLQEMKKLPLEKYILFCKKEVQHPIYLKKNSMYNLTCIMKEKYDSNPINILNKGKWPDAYNTTLNDTQLEALKLALTHEMAIIQGPPGTGKTYIGLKIMNILLENNATEEEDGSTGPILVVCYTNHALDQFLEGMLEFCPEGIVRVGGRSSSKLLEKFNLRELRNNPPLDKKIKTNVYKNISNCQTQLKIVSKQIQHEWQQLLHLETTIVNTEDLKAEMNDLHYKQLSDSTRSVNKDTNVMRTWLKAANADMNNHLFKAAKQHLAKVIASQANIEEKNDLVIKSKLTATKMLFKDRVKVYRFWLNKHCSKIEAKIEELLEFGEGTELEELVLLQEASRNDILHDEVLQQYMDEAVFNCIKECVELENKNPECENSYIQFWLLSNLSKTEQLLDAIEQLTEKKKEPTIKQETYVDSEAKMYENQWVIDESDSNSLEIDKEESEDDSELETEMNDIDDVGISFKELARDFKVQENKEIQMLQRAERLRIDLSERQDDEEDAWQAANNNMSYSKVFSLFHKTEPFTMHEAQDIADIWKLPLRDRYRLYKFWVLSTKKKIVDKLIMLTAEFKNILQRKKEANSLKDIAILQRAKVIGMTTTGAAKHRKVLQSIGCKIIVVEEAAEVLEAHIVTTLNSKCQHLILIGDHQQLRPSPTVHRLAVDYDLEMSLFERLVNNHVIHVTLNEQHRMRPEISQFIHPIYPNLDDHYSVTGFEDIKGVNANVFFLQHALEESEVDDSTSKSNQHEAKFITALCKYFLQHGYQGRQITILAAYSGQVTSIRNEMEPEKDIYDFVRVTSIDNYQGEENDIILLSLVRSNSENAVGFLKTDNRVCVALSRAKKGMFVIGNLPLLASKSKLWKQILTMAQDERVTGVNMKLVCVNHENHITYVSNAEHFQKEVPEGGCYRKCEAVLPCGHLCTRMCHASDRFHEESKCEQPCKKKCPKGHPCQKNCYEECGDCEVIVKKTMPLCGHDDDVPCSKDVEEVLCSQPCDQEMVCGHICHGECGKCFNNAEHQKCSEKVNKTWPVCLHTANVECHTDESLDPCPEKCLKHLECGHTCKGTCGGCLSGRVHKPCSNSCNIPLPCGHLCKGPCGGQCVPCINRCITICRHVGCNKKNCGELCDPCTEYCALTCAHRQCALRCMDECRVPLCTKSCGKPVPNCKHKCYSLCGEPCVCYPCEKDKFSLIDFSGKKKPNYAVEHDKRERAKKFEVKSDTVLMKIPQCQEIFTLNQLDRWVESFDPLGASFIKCPNCSAPIMKIARYENLNKQRSEKRENMKAALIQASTVSKESIETLRQTKDMCGSFCSIDEGEFLLKKPEEIDANHAQALTLQIRFSYVLLKIYNIHKEFSDNLKFPIKKWKSVITSINRNVTNQFFNEMTLELYRLLLLEQIYILMKYIQDIDITMSPVLKSTCKMVLKDNKQKLTQEDKQAFQETVYDLYLCFQDLDADNLWKVKITNLYKSAKEISRILDQDKKKDLKTIMHEAKMN